MHLAMDATQAGDRVVNSKAPADIEASKGAHGRL
jgi:hypothetical protein